MNFLLYFNFSILLKIKGAYGSTFYIILSGSVDIFKNKAETQTPDKSPSKNQRYSGSPLISSPRRLRHPNESPDSSPIKLRSITTNAAAGGGGESPVSTPRRRQKLSEKFTYSWQSLMLEEVANQDQSPTKKSNFSNKNNYLVKTLGVGAAFGELSLLENKPRQATIICKSQCSFAVLEKIQFKSILRKFCLFRFYYFTRNFLLEINLHIEA